MVVEGALFHELVGPRRLEAAIGRLSRLDLLSKGQAHGEFWLELEQLCAGLASAPGRP